MIKKIIACLSIFLFSIFVLSDHMASADSFSLRAVSAPLLASGSIIKQHSGYVSLDEQSNRSTWYVDLTSYTDGGVFHFVGTGSGYGSYIFSDVDFPQDIEIGYTFVANGATTLNNASSFDYTFSGPGYLYISFNKDWSYTVEASSPSPSPSVTPEVSPSVTPEVSPSVTPEVSPSVTPEVSTTPQPDNGFSIHYDVPFDYYMIIIIIILGGILICQLFKN